MARKRMIDPNFWRDEKIGELTHTERLLFIGLWTYADDEGIGIANSTLLNKDVFPYDKLKDAAISNSLNKLSEKKLITLYKANGQNFYYINNFKKHQKINNPTSSKLPLPPQKEDKKDDEIPKNEDKISPTEQVSENYGSTTVGLPTEDNLNINKTKIEVEVCNNAPAPTCEANNTLLFSFDKIINHCKTVAPIIYERHQRKTNGDYRLGQLIDSLSGAVSEDAILDAITHAAKTYISGDRYDGCDLIYVIENRKEVMRLEVKTDKPKNKRDEDNAARDRLLADIMAEEERRKTQ